jgi:hypothetical protein
MHIKPVDRSQHNAALMARSMPRAPAQTGRAVDGILSISSEQPPTKSNAAATFPRRSSPPFATQGSTA